LPTMPSINRYKRAVDRYGQLNISKHFVHASRNHWYDYQIRTLSKQ
jgi:hypothetical protein